MSEKTLSVINSVSIFQPLTEKERALIVPYFKVRHFSAGATICVEGESSSDFFIITSGFVSVLRNRNEKEIFITTLSDGMYFGESALFHDLHRIATVRAQTDVDVLIMSREGLQTFVEKNPVAGNRVLFQMLKEVFDRLSKMVQEFQLTQAEGLGQSEIDKYFS